MPDREQKCEQRIGVQLDGRVSDFGALADLSEASDVAELATLLEDRSTRELFSEIVSDCAARELTDPDGIARMEPEALEAALDRVSLDAVRDRAMERTGEYPLAVSTYRVHRIDLSTGGPADWLEVHVDPDSAMASRIVYHFADWFDHAERVLEGPEFDAAERFVTALIPEL